MNKAIIFITFLGGLMPPPLLFSQATFDKSLKSTSGVELSEQQWKIVLIQFEDSVLSLSKWLEKNQQESKKLQIEIGVLERKTESLRSATGKNINVIDEIRLKNILNELKEKLEKNSTLQREWDVKQKDFEQKSLSLLALYNDRIKTELESPDNASEPAGLDSKLNRLADLLQKRNLVQNLLKQYQKKNSDEKLLPVTSLSSLETDDRERLQLTMDLFQDSKREIEDGLEKLSLEEDEIKNELNLQGKMQDFLEDVHRVNEDSDLSNGSLKQNELEGMVGINKKEKLEKRLEDVDNKINRDQKTLGQITRFMDGIQKKMDLLDERKRK
jgi:hypothetical protein